MIPPVTRISLRKAHWELAVEIVGECCKSFRLVRIASVQAIHITLACRVLNFELLGVWSNKLSRTIRSRRKRTLAPIVSDFS